MARGSGPNVQLGRADARRLERLATLTGVSKSEVVAAALAAYSPDGGDPAGTGAAHPLDDLARQLDCLERDQTILIEMLALFIRDYLSGTAADPEPEPEAARALGRVRFEQFIEQLARHFQRGGSFVRDVERGFGPDAGREGPRQLREPVTA